MQKVKDHLGNVRTTFAVRDTDYSTDFETASNPYFDNYDQVTKLTSALKRSGNTSHRLAGGANETVGLMKSLLVSKGDKVSAEVYGKYIAATNQDDAINTGALITALVNMLSGGAVSGEAALTSENLTGFSSAAIADNSNEQSPRAYLNYIMLDKDFNYLTSGFDRLSTSAADPGDGTGTHQKLSFEEILIDQDGYLMVFLSNESQQPVEVFWDDFRVDHHHNAVLQADDYYPFGLTFNSYQRSYSKANNFKYNGKEEQEETGWYDYGARMYMPDIGRWGTIDPLSDKFHPVSPYNYVLNNPIILTDPDGRAPCPPGVDCSNPLPKMERIRANRASNLGPGFVRNGGARRHGGHDLYAKIGTRVNSVMNGEVIKSGNSSTYGNHVTVKHTYSVVNPETDVYETHTYYSFYAHLSAVDVTEGETVEQGQRIGEAGITGNASSGADGIDEHLHFEFGTSLRAGNFLASGGLVDPNMAYKDVNFSSQNPDADQSKTGVIKTRTNRKGDKLSITFQDFNSTTSLGQDDKFYLQNVIERFLNQ